jgi:hypothetical protein
MPGRKSRRCWNTSRKSSQKGGLRIGGGSYGVAFRPALPCMGRAGVRTANHVSKIVHSQTMVDEWRRGRIIHGIPGINQYLTYPDDQCYLNTNATNAANQFNADRLGGFRNMMGRFPQLISADGGDPVYKDFTLNANQYVPFVESLPNLFEGLQLLHANHVVHRDIKPPNIVTRQLPDGRFETKMIDVGLLAYTNRVPGFDAAAQARNQLSVLNPRENDIYARPTSYMPYDLTLMYSGDGFQRYTDIPHALNNIRGLYSNWRNHQQELFQILPYTAFNYTTQGFVSHPSYNDLILILNAPGSLYRAHGPAEIETIFQKADIWMLGFTLLSVWTQLINQTVVKFINAAGVIQYQVYMVKQKFSAELGDQDFDVSMIPQIIADAGHPDLVPRATINWYTAISRDITVPLSRMCYAMMHPDPRHRPTLVESLATFQGLLPMIRQHFSGADVQQHLVALRIARPGAVPVLAVESPAAAGGGGGGAATPAASQNNGSAGGKKQEGGRRNKKTRRARK